MLRARLNDSLKAAMKAKEANTLATVRLIVAALKDRDIAARSKGEPDGISDDEILSMLQSMIKQRHESIDMYTKGGRPELATREAAEIAVIQGFLPEQMDDAAVLAAIDEVLAETGAESLKDMGRVMALLKEHFGGRMDFSKAGAEVKKRLS